MSNDRKWIYLTYIISIALVGWVLHQAFALAMDIFAYPNTRVLEVAPMSAVIGGSIAVIAGFLYFRQEKVQTYSLEVLQELKKVTWPLRKTAYLSTVVVLILVVICAVFLGMFDMLSNWFVGAILSA